MRLTRQWPARSSLIGIWSLKPPAKGLLPTDAFNYEGNDEFEQCAEHLVCPQLSLRPDTSRRQGTRYSWGNHFQDTISELGIDNQYPRDGMRHPQSHVSEVPLQPRRHVLWQSEEANSVWCAQARGSKRILGSIPQRWSVESVMSHMAWDWSSHALQFVVIHSASRCSGVKITTNWMGWHA
jgi:hypothetical protein